MSIIARLGVILGINTAEFNKGLDEATKKTKEFERQQKETAKRNKQASEEMAAALTKVGAAAAAASIVIVDSWKRAADITDISEGFDITVESLLATEKAFMLAAGQAENIGTVLNKLAQAQDAAKEGNDAVRESFARLGIEASKVDRANLDELFLEVAKALSKIEDTSKRAALAQDLLGKAAKGVNWAEFTKQYKEFSDPDLVAAIEKNDKAWESIEISIKSIAMQMQKIIAPISQMVLDSQQIAKNFKDIETYQYGIASVFQFMFAPKTIGVFKNQKPSGDILEALPAEVVDTPMPYQDSKYQKQSEKEKAEAKRAAEEAKRVKETRNALNIEIGLIQQKIKYGNEMFAIDMKGVALGQKAIADEKSLVALNMDLASIRANAAKERAKDKAQVDLINKKEAEEIAARTAQYNNEVALRQENEKRLHELKIKAIRNESESIAKNQTVQTYNALTLLELESKRFEMGSNAYDLAKLELEQNNKLRDIHLQASEALKQVATEYEESAKSAKDLQVYEENIAKIKGQTVRELNYTILLEGQKLKNLKEQQQIEDKMFALDLAAQKGREIAQIQTQYKIETDMLGLESRRYFLSQNAYNLQKLELDNVNLLNAAERKYTQQALEAYYQMERLGGGQKAREQYEQRMKAIEETRDLELDAIRQVNEMRERALQKDIERQRSWTEGWKHASMRFQEDAQRAFDRGAKAFGMVMSNMDAAISNFVETGKFKFEDFATAVIKDIIRMEMQAQAAMLFRMMLGSIGGFSFSKPNFDAGITSNVGFAAAGGEIDGPTIVGENGPELFIPSQRGTIIPNTIAPSMGAMSQPQVVYNGPYIENMSAIDTQSAAQFLSKNKMSVWAANKSADRSVPVSR